MAALSLVLAGCGETRALRRDQVALEERVARLERDFASLSRPRAAAPEAAPGSGPGSGPTAAAPAPARPQPLPLDPLAAAAGPPRFALHLASYKRTRDVRRGWDVLSLRFPGVLGALSPQIEAVTFGDGRGTFYRLKAAGFGDHATAQAACDRLLARHAYCEVQDDAGTPGDQFWNS